MTLNIPPHPATFIGRTTILNTVAQVDDGVVKGLRKNRWFPWASKPVPILSGVKEYMDKYQERLIIDLRCGYREEKARIYFLDADSCTPFSSVMNPTQLLELEDAKAERDFLFNQRNKLKDILKQLGHDDLWRAMVKDEHDFYVNKMRPSFLGGNKQNKKK